MYKTYKNLNPNSLITINYIEGQTLEEAITNALYEENIEEVGRIEFYYLSRKIAEYYSKAELKIIKELKEKYPNSTISFSKKRIYLDRTPILKVEKSSPVIEYFYTKGYTKLF